MRIGACAIIFHLSDKSMKSQVLHTVWCDISGEAAEEMWKWSLLRVKGLNYQFSLAHLYISLLKVGRMYFLTLGVMIFEIKRAQPVSQTCAVNGFIPRRPLPLSWNGPNVNFCLVKKRCIVNQSMLHEQKSWAETNRLLLAIQYTCILSLRFVITLHRSLHKAPTWMIPRSTNCTSTCVLLLDVRSN